MATIAAIFKLVWNSWAQHTFLLHSHWYYTGLETFHCLSHQLFWGLWYHTILFHCRCCSWVCELDNLVIFCSILPAHLRRSEKSLLLTSSYNPNYPSLFNFCDFIFKESFLRVVCGFFILICFVDRCLEMLYSHTVNIMADTAVFVSAILLYVFYLSASFSHNCLLLD